MFPYVLASRQTHASQVPKKRLNPEHSTDCQACAAYILGLPERPVEEIALRDCSFTFAAEPKPMVPAMADGVESCAAQGIIASYVHHLTLENVRMRGLKGERLVLNSVETLNDD